MTKLQNITSYLIFFLLFLVQFVYFPIGTSFFEGSKVIFAEILISCLLIFRLYSKNGLRFKQFNKVLLGSLVLLIIVSVFHLVANQTPTTLFGNPFRLQGTLLLWFLISFSVLSSGISVENKIKPWLIFVILLFQFIFSVIFIGVGAERPIGTMGEPNALAANVIFMWPFLFFPKPKNWKYWALVAVGITIVGVILLITGSRSGIIAFGIQLIFLYLIRTFYGKALVPTVLCVLLIVLSFASVPYFSRGDKYENRAEIWQSALNASSKTPFLGVGFGNGEYALHDGSVRLNNHLQGHYVDSSHNIFLDYLLQSGVIGLLALMYLIFNTLRQFIARNNIRNITLFLGIIASLSFNPASVVSLLALWWLIGQGAMSSKK